MQLRMRPPVRKRGTKQRLGYAWSARSCEAHGAPVQPSRAATNACGCGHGTIADYRRPHKRIEDYQRDGVGSLTLNSRNWPATTSGLVR